MGVNDTADWQLWCNAVASGVRGVPDETLARVAETLAVAGIVLTAGNGGSSCLASHAAQALLKPNYAAGGGQAALCLTDNAATLTAHANDGGWAMALANVADPFLLARMRPVLWLFSSSGTSRNLVELAQLAEGYPIIAFTGFDGGPLRQFATLSVHVDSRDYEVVEPVHDALLHRVQYHLRRLLA